MSIAKSQFLERTNESDGQKTICIVLLIVTFALMTGMLTACNSGDRAYVTYYYNDELLEQEKYWQYHWSLHGDKRKDDLVWDKDSNDVLKTIKKPCNKPYSERGKKVFLCPKISSTAKWSCMTESCLRSLPHFLTHMASAITTE